MIFAQANLPGDKTLYIIGLSEENLTRLKAGEPIKTGPQHQIPNAEFFIFYGKTEKEMFASFKTLIGPETKIHIDPRTQ